MSLYQVQKLLYALNGDPEAQAQFSTDLDGLMQRYDLSSEARGALRQADVGRLYGLGVNGQIPMHFAALSGLAWPDDLDPCARACAATARYAPESTR